MNFRVQNRRSRRGAGHHRGWSRSWRLALVALALGGLSANAQTPSAGRVSLRWTPASSERYTALIRHRDGSVERVELPEALFERTVEVGPGDCAVALTAANAAGESEPSAELALPGGC